MAHADYNCCMIYDSKMEYAGYDASTKERACEHCLQVMRDKTGTIFVTPAEVVAGLGAMTDKAALEWLHAVGYEPCCYDNEFDLYLASRGLVLTGQDGGKWGHKLASLETAK